MDLRDQFAIEALKAFLQQPLPAGRFWNLKALSNDSYVLADEMLRIRENPDLKVYSEESQSKSTD